MEYRSRETIYSYEGYLFKLTHKAGEEYLVWIGRRINAYTVEWRELYRCKTKKGAKGYMENIQFEGVRAKSL